MLGAVEHPAGLLARVGDHELSDAFQDELGGNPPQAFVGPDISAAVGQAGRAGEVQPQNRRWAAIRPGAAGFRGAKEGDDGFAQRGGDMHGTGVVGDHEFTAAHPLDHFRQGGLAAKVQAGSGRGPGDGLAQGLVVPAAENGEPHLRGLAGQGADDFGKIFGGPAFVVPAGAGLEGDPTDAIRRPFGLDGGGAGGAFRQPGERGVGGDAERVEDGQIPVHGVRVEGSPAHGHIVEASRAFAHFIQTDEQSAVGEPGKGGTAGQALEVNDPVEFLRARPADAAEHFGPEPGFGPAFAFKEDEAGQIGIAFNERGEGRVNPPVDFAPGQVEFEQPEDGQGLDDIPEGTGLEDEDFQGADVFLKLAGEGNPWEKIGQASARTEDEIQSRR